MSGPVPIAPGLQRAHAQVDVEGCESWLIALREKCDRALVPMITINRGHSEPETQARVMLKYATRYGPTKTARTAEGRADGLDLTTTYGRAATELLALPRADVETWTPVVRDLYRRGLLHKHGHAAKPAEAVDVEPQCAEVIRAAKANGARNAYDDGPCIHIDLPIGEPDAAKANAWRSIQTELTRAGYAPGPIDGIPGPKTLVAVRAAGWALEAATANGATLDAIAAHCRALPSGSGR